MRFVKRFLLSLITPLLFTLLIVTALDVAIVRTAGSPSPIKKVLSDSGVYQTVVPALLQQADNASDKNGSVSLIDPSVKAAAEQTLTPQFLQTNTESFLDGTYHWLDGKTTKPDFVINLASKKTVFAGLVADHAKQVVSTLPKCVGTADPSNFDPFKATCLPLGMTPEVVRANTYQQLADNKNFLSNPLITADTIKGNGSNQSIFDGQLKSVPSYYRWAKKSPLALMFLCALLITAIVLLSATKRKGARHVGIIFTVTGVLFLAIAWGINYGVTKQALPRLNLSNKVMQDDIKLLTTDLTHAIDKNNWIAGGAYVVIGAATIAGSILVNRGRPEDIQSRSATEDKSGKSQLDSEQPKTESIEPKEPRSIKVQ